MAATERRRTGLEYWEGIFKGQEQSGLSVSSYCTRIKESRYRFYYWKKRLSVRESRPRSKAEAGFIEIPMPGAGTQGGAVRIHVGCFVLEVAESVSDESLVRAARILQSLVEERD